MKGGSSDEDFPTNVNRISESVIVLDTLTLQFCHLSKSFGALTLKDIHYSRSPSQLPAGGGFLPAMFVSTHDSDVTVKSDSMSILIPRGPIGSLKVI